MQQRFQLLGLLAALGGLVGCTDDIDPGGADVPIPGKPVIEGQQVCPACDDHQGPGNFLPPELPGELALQNRITFHPVEVETAIEADDTCSLLPSDGPCSAACDLTALEQYIPPGTCVTFICKLDDGRTMLAGGCNAP